MKIGTIAFSGPRVLAASALLGACVYAGLRVKPEEHTKLVEQQPQVSMTATQAWDGMSIDDKVYYLKTGYHDLPPDVREEVTNYLFKDMVDQKYDVFSGKVRNGYQYVTGRIKGMVEEDNDAYMRKNLERLRSFLGGEK